MSKSLKNLLEEVQEELEIQEAAAKEPAPAPEEDDEPTDPSLDDDDDDEKDEKIGDHAPDGKGHYTADDLREIIDYVRDLIEKELNDKDDDEEDGDKKKDSDDIGEIGLDLIYEYADLLPETVINQIVDDLKDMFEIEDTMLESILEEGSAFFSKSKKGPAAKAAIKSMKAFIKKNKKGIMKRNKLWRQSEIGQKIVALHKKIFKGMGKIKGKRVVHV